MQSLPAAPRSDAVGPELARWLEQCVLCNAARAEDARQLQLSLRLQTNGAGGATGTGTGTGTSGRRKAAGIDSAGAGANTGSAAGSDSNADQEEQFCILDISRPRRGDVAAASAQDIAALHAKIYERYESLTAAKRFLSATASIVRASSNSACCR